MGDASMSSTARNIRVDDELWRSVQERAAAEGATVSELIRQWLGDYAAGSSAGNVLAYRPKPSGGDIIDQIIGLAEQLRESRI